MLALVYATVIAVELILAKMVESIKELKKKYLIRTRVEGYKKFLLYTRIFEKISIYFFKVFLYTPLTANQLTFLGIICSLIGCILLSIGNYWFSVIAAFFLWLNIIMDFIDGRTARYRKQISLKGGFLDGIVHGVMIPNLVLLSLGIGAYISTANIIFFYAGVCACFFSQATRCILKNRELILLIKTKKCYKRIHCITEKKFNFVTTIFGAPTMYIIEIVFIMAILNKLHWLVLFYGIFVPIRWFGLAYYLSNIIDKNIENNEVF